LHQDSLWRALDLWLSELTGDAFDSLLPILRRAFANFQAPERRKMGEKVKHLHTTSTSGGKRTSEGPGIAAERADRVLPILAKIMGIA